MNLASSRLYEKFPHISHITEHEGCQGCQRMRAWVAGRTRSMIHVRSYKGTQAGMWLKDSFEWGPHSWPLYWCDLEDQLQIDCGAFASLFSHCLKTALVPHNRAQMIFAATSQERAQWDKRWRDVSAPSRWILDASVYHESIVAFPDDGGSQLIDTTDMVLLVDRCDDPRYKPLFVRVTPQGWNPAAGTVTVAGKSLQIGRWQRWDVQ